MRRSLLVLVCVVGCAGASVRRPKDMKIWNEGSWTHGDVIVRADPDTVYAAVSEYTRWPQIFTDIANVEVDLPIVKTTSTGGSKRTLRFANEPEKRTIRFEEIGGRAPATAVIVLEKAGRTSTRVHASLHAEVSGSLRWFVSSDRVRRAREREVIHDLQQVRAYFASQRDFRHQQQGWKR